MAQEILNKNIEPVKHMLSLDKYFRFMKATLPSPFHFSDQRISLLGLARLSAFIYEEYREAREIMVIFEAEERAYQKYLARQPENKSSHSPSPSSSPSPSPSVTLPINRYEEKKEVTHPIHHFPLSSDDLTEISNEIPQKGFIDKLTGPFKCEFSDIWDGCRFETAFAKKALPTLKKSQEKAKFRRLMNGMTYIALDLDSQEQAGEIVRHYGGFIINQPVFRRGQLTKFYVWTVEIEKEGRIKEWADVLHPPSPSSFVSPQTLPHPKQGDERKNEETKVVPTTTSPSSTSTVVTQLLQKEPKGKELKDAVAQMPAQEEKPSPSSDPIRIISAESNSSASTTSSSSSNSSSTGIDRYVLSEKEVTIPPDYSLEEVKEDIVLLLAGAFKQTSEEFLASNKFLQVFVGEAGIHTLQGNLGTNFDLAEGGYEIILKLELSNKEELNKITHHYGNLITNKPEWKNGELTEIRMMTCNIIAKKNTSKWAGHKLNSPPSSSAGTQERLPTDKKYAPSVLAHFKPAPSDSTTHSSSNPSSSSSLSSSSSTRRNSRDIASVISKRNAATVISQGDFMETMRKWFKCPLEKLTNASELEDRFVKAAGLNRSQGSAISCHQESGTTVMQRPRYRRMSNGETLMELDLGSEEELSKIQEMYGEVITDTPKWNPRGLTKIYLLTTEIQTEHWLSIWRDCDKISGNLYIPS